MKIFQLGACLKCLGDLALDQDDWLCLQCGTYYYTNISDVAGFPRDGTLRIAKVKRRPAPAQRDRPVRKAG